MKKKMITIKNISLKNELKKPSIGYGEKKSLYNDIKKNIQGIENKKKIPKKTIKQLFKIK